MCTYISSPTDEKEDLVTLSVLDSKDEFPAEVEMAPNELKLCCCFEKPSPDVLQDLWVAGRLYGDHFFYKKIFFSYIYRKVENIKINIFDLYKSKLLILMLRRLNDTIV